MQTVCQLHQQHSDIFRHGQEQLAKILGLFRLVRLQLQLAELRYTINETADLISKRRSISSNVATVSSTVSCSKPVTIDAVSSFFSEKIPATSTGCEKYGSPEARLRAVRLHGENISAVESFLIRARIVTTNHFHKLILTHHAAGLLKHDAVAYPSG